MSLRSPRNRGRGERGQSVVEFAIVVPVMLLILLGIADLGRIYTTMMNVESAAREAADFGTTLGAAHWDAATIDATRTEMERRACVASSNLPDYSGDDPSGTVVTCSNPSFGYCVTTSAGGACEPFDPTAGCEDPLRAQPCRVTVTLSYVFHLITPLQIGLPSTLTFERDSTFAMTDIDLAPDAP
jgi:Flp pilus assembly protein TadG